MEETNIANEWGAYLEVSATRIRVGEPVTMTPRIFGTDRDDFLYNYVWFNGDWSGGNWETTLALTGSYTTDRSFTLTPLYPGMYTLGVDIVLGDGSLFTVQRRIDVYEDLLSEQVDRGVLDAAGAPIISVRGVSMVFNMASERFGSLKEYFIALMRRELSFREFRALNGISFDVRRGEAFGLVGTNGSGKSTMLKIIAGVLDASEGSCTVTGTIAPLIELGAGFDLELTARENIYLNGSLLGYRKEFIDRRFDDIVAFAELEDFLDMPLKNYSSGMVARIAFAIATITEPDILIVDETLSVGDFLFQRKCEHRIQELVASNNVTVLLVSHSIELVERICDRVCWIERGQQRMIGPAAEVCAAYREMRS